MEWEGEYTRGRPKRGCRAMGEYRWWFRRGKREERRAESTAGAGGERGGKLWLGGEGDR